MSALGSLTSLSALLSFPVFVACGYGDHVSDRDGYWSDTPGVAAPRADVERATIDVDQSLDVEPGAGAGVFIEYMSGGSYRITTSCDVAQGTDCYWDIVVTPLTKGSLGRASPFALESDDSLTFGPGSQLRFVAYTGRDFDGFTFETDPGSGIELDALLDNAPANRYLFWVGDGALRSGAPSNPIDLLPSGN